MALVGDAKKSLPEIILTLSTVRLTIDFEFVLGITFLRFTASRHADLLIVVAFPASIDDLASKSELFGIIFRTPFNLQPMEC